MKTKTLNPKNELFLSETIDFIEKQVQYSAQT